MGLAVQPQRLLERLRQRPRVGDLLEQLHPLLVLDALGLHLGDGLATLLVGLRHQHRERVVEDRLDHREHVERVGLGLGVDQVERGLRERRQRLVEREVVLQRRRQLAACGRTRRARPAASSTPEASSSSLSDRACSARRARPRSSSWLSSISTRSVSTGSAGWLMTLRIIAWLTRIRETSGSGCALRRRSNVSSVQLTTPSAGFVRWILRSFFGSSPALATSARVLDRVLGRLHDDVAGRVEPGAAGAPGDLVELARLEQPVPGAVELRQPGEDDRADRDVDADAERVGPADHLQQPGLRELLDQPAVARQHPGVVDADAAADQLGQRPAEAGGEAERADRLGDRVALLARAELRRQQRLRPLQGRGLREVHDVDRRLVGRDELLEQLVQRLHRPREVERHGPLGVVDQRGLAAGAPRQVARGSR